MVCSTDPITDYPGTKAIPWRLHCHNRFSSLQSIITPLVLIKISERASLPLRTIARRSSGSRWEMVLVSNCERFIRRKIVNGRQRQKRGSIHLSDEANNERVCTRQETKATHFLKRGWFHSWRTILLIGFYVIVWRCMSIFGLAHLLNHSLSSGFYDSN